jgi:hypothetical protein
MNEKPEGYDKALTEAHARMQRQTVLLQHVFRPIDVIRLLVVHALAVRLVHEDAATTAAWLRALADEVEADEPSMN